MPKLLELFKGTGSVGVTAKKMGWKVLSLDNDPTFSPDIVEDVLKWDYKSIPTPDFIWASPPCTTFSLAAAWVKHRQPGTGKALTEEAKEGDRILRRTLLIIRYFLKKNPNLKFCIENPLGFMRKMKELSSFERYTTSYSAYGFPVSKPTDFWTNFHLSLKPRQPGTHTIGKGEKWVVKLREYMDRKGRNVKRMDSLLGMVPYPLVKTILEQGIA